MIFDELHRPRLGRTGHGHRPGMRQESIKSIELLAQMTFDMIDGVNEPRIHLNLSAADHTHAAGLADARFVVTIDIGTHSEFRLVFAGIQQSLDLYSVADRIAAASDSAGDGTGLNPVAVNSDVHLGRCTNQVLSLTKVNQK